VRKPSIGVANLLDFADRLTVWPAYLAEGERGAGFAEVALHGKRDDHRAPRAADAQRQPTRTRMSSHLNRAIELFDARTLQCLPPSLPQPTFPLVHHDVGRNSPLKPIRNMLRFVGVFRPNRK
jgi:hypothetical protein